MRVSHNCELASAMAAPPLGTESAVITSAVNFRLFSPSWAPGLALCGSQLFKHPSVIMTKILSRVGSRILYFGLEMLTQRFNTSKTRLVGPMARRIRGCSLLGNVNHCLDLGFLINSVSKAKLIVRASFPDI